VHVPLSFFKKFPDGKNEKENQDHVGDRDHVVFYYSRFCGAHYYQLEVRSKKQELRRGRG
jgi:hypothetical protein